MTKPQVGIIGSGISGLTCAAELDAHGFHVTVLDKAKAPGGRMSTRWVPDLGESVGFDHGAQYFTARSPELRAAAKLWQSAGVVARWDGRLVAIDGDAISPSSRTTERFVGTPGMNAVCQHLARTLDVRFETRVGKVLRGDGRWILHSSAGDEVGSFDLLLCSTPAPQAANLLREAAPALARRAQAVTMQPCWALMVAFDTPLAVDFDGAFINEGPVSWAARMSAKPERQQSPERWVLHAGADWSIAHLEEDESEVIAPLLGAFFEAIRSPAQPSRWSRAHRWRYALADTPLDAGHLLDLENAIGVCGDWTNGNRVEGAFTSGLGLSKAVLERWGD